MQRFFSVITAALGLAGFFLFLVSLYIESLVFQEFLGAAFLGFTFAFALELAKSVSILCGPLLAHIPQLKRLSLRIVLLIMRLGLIAVSVFCAALFLARHIDRPNISAVRSADLGLVEQQAEEEQQRILMSLLTEYEVSVRNHELALQTESKQINHRYRNALDELRSMLNLEMDNVINGTFKGPRYREIEARLSRQEEQLKTELDDLYHRFQKQSREISLEYKANQQSEKSRILADKTRKLTAVRASNYLDDERVSLPMILAARNIFTSLFGLRLADVSIGLLLAILLSFVGEITLLAILGVLSRIMSTQLIAQYDLWNINTLGLHEARQGLLEYGDVVQKQKTEVRRQRKSSEEQIRNWFTT